MIRLLLSATTDLDADAHVRWLIANAGARTIDIVTREWPLIARAALRLRRAPGNELITVGEAAFLAASLARRLPTFHLVVGAPTRAELAALRKHLGVRVVVSTIAALQLLRAGGVATSRIERLSIPTIDALRERSEARRRLGLASSFTLILPGTIRPDSGHRLAIWGCALLAFRDPSWQFLVSGRGDADRARTFIEATMPPEHRPFRLLRESEASDAIAAADVALFAGDGVPERAAFDDCLRAGVPIVVARRVIEPEQVDAASTFDAYKARHVARAVLLAVDKLGATSAAVPAPGRSWSDLLDQRALAH